MIARGTLISRRPLAARRRPFEPPCTVATMVVSRFAALASSFVAATLRPIAPTAFTASGIAPVLVATAAAAVVIARTIAARVVAIA